MLLVDLAQETYLAIKSNKARSGLTILGIVIGIGSVIAMISIGKGTQKSIESSIQSIGSNLIMISPSFQRNIGSSVSAGRGSAQTLTIDDAEAIANKVSGIKSIASDISKRYQITFKSKNTNTQVVGTETAYATVRNVTIDLGNFITNQDYKAQSKVAVLGPTTRDDLFGENVNPVGQKIKINKIEFKVVGVTKSKGGSGMNNQDDIIYIPLTAAKAYLSGDKYLSTISIEATDSNNLTMVQNQVSELLLDRHKITNVNSADFQIMNQADIVATASSVTGTFTMLLAAIAGISLVVGGIGIMNMMLTNVTERTREIGLRKAIGAQRNDISNQFLAESIMLTFIGGILGIALGWSVAQLISKLASISTDVSLDSVLLAFGVSALIGIVFGYYPAKRAAKLNPIDALRYE